MLLLCQICLESLRELIGAGGAFKAATNARKTLDGFLYLHASDQRGNALGVARASAVILHVLDDAVFDIDIDHSGANTSGLIGQMFHTYLCPFLNFLEMGIYSDGIVVGSFHGKINQERIEVALICQEEIVGGEAMGLGSGK